jgi:hypothetical protein
MSRVIHLSTISCRCHLYYLSMLFHFPLQPWLARMGARKALVLLASSLRITQYHGTSLLVVSDKLSQQIETQDRFRLLSQQNWNTGTSAPRRRRAARAAVQHACTALHSLIAPRPHPTAGESNRSRSKQVPSARHFSHGCWRVLTVQVRPATDGAVVVRHSSAARAADPLAEEHRVGQVHAWPAGYRIPYPLLYKALFSSRKIL